MTSDVRRTVTVQLDTGSAAWRVHELEYLLATCEENRQRDARAEQCLRDHIASLERENDALWAFVKAVDAIGNAITTVDRDRALDAAEAATEARAALNDLRGNR